MNWLFSEKKVERIFCLFSGQPSSFFGSSTYEVMILVKSVYSIRQHRLKKRWRTVSSWRPSRSYESIVTHIWHLFAIGVLVYLFFIY